MDVFGTTCTVVQQVYDLTIFIRGVVLEMKNQESSIRDIHAQIAHESVFLETFKIILFEQDDSRIKFANLPANLRKDIESILSSLSDFLSKYDLFALKHGINVFSTQTTTDQVHNALDSDADATPSKQSDSFRNRLKTNFPVLHKKLDSLDWALFQKDKLLHLVTEYSKCTERLRQVMTLILLYAGALGHTTRSEIAHTKVGKDLGLSQAAERQLRLREASDLEPLDGPLISTTDGRSEENHELYRIGEYEDPSGFGSTSVLLEKHSFHMPSGVNDLTEDQKHERLEPIRDLASLLRGSATSNSRDRSSGKSGSSSQLCTLECLGYVVYSEQNFALLVYRLPSPSPVPSLASPTPSSVLTLYDYIADPNAKPTLTQRFSIAHALASTVFGIHICGWLHKSICSRAILMFPSSSSPSSFDSLTHSARASDTPTRNNDALIPYLAGWGVARPDTEKDSRASRKSNFDTSDGDLEANLYRHPERYGKPESSFRMRHDIYALGVVLLEIGSWKRISESFKEPIRMARERKRLPPVTKVQQGLMTMMPKMNLGREMGEVYARVVERCLVGDFGKAQGGGEESEEDVALSMRFREDVIEKIRPGVDL